MPAGETVDAGSPAGWGHLLLTYGELRHPMLLHGSDFTRLMRIPKPAKERIVEAMFSDPAYPHREESVVQDVSPAVGCAGLRSSSWQIDFKPSQDQHFATAPYGQHHWPSDGDGSLPNLRLIRPGSRWRPYRQLHHLGYAEHIF